MKSESEKSFNEYAVKESPPIDELVDKEIVRKFEEWKSNGNKVPTCDFCSKESVVIGALFSSREGALGPYNLCQECYNFRDDLSGCFHAELFMPEFVD